MHGQFIWYELTTPDVDAAKEFYWRFTGWGTQAFDNDYTMWTTGGVPVAGLFRLSNEKRQQGIPPNWMPYIESDNVDETATKAVSLGGRLVQGPDDIPGTGRFAVLQDPQGATFGVYRSSRGMSGWDGTAVVGRFSWHELMTTDRVAAFAFYSALFGWGINGEMDMGGGEMYSMFGHGEKMYGGMYDATGDMAGMRPFWLVYIHVKDVGTAVAAATKAGATVQRPQMDIPGGSIAILGDPQGAGFALHHATAQAPAAKPAAKQVATGARRVAKKAVKAAKKLTKKVTKKVAKAAKKVKTAAKRGTKAAAKKASRKGAKTAARPKAKVKAARKGTSSARPSARKKTKTARKSAAGRRR